jgi:tol-pal system protein YbgF
MRSTCLGLRTQRLLMTTALALSCAGAAQAGLLEDDEARRAILDLRQRLEASNGNIKALGEENTQLRRALLDLQAQIDAFKSDIARGRGQQEQLARDLSELQQRQKDTQAVLDERLRKLEPIKVTVDGREFLVDVIEKRDYEQALEVFRKGDFVAARAVLASFVQRYSQSAYLPSALFWLGNAEYATKDYKESMQRFRQMLAAAPAHLRAAEAMLAISNIQIELKDTKGARKTLEDLIKTYPDSETAQAAKDRLTRLR